jgi:hypothetical protein
MNDRAPLRALVEISGVADPRLLDLLPYLDDASVHGRPMPGAASDNIMSLHNEARHGVMVQIVGLAGKPATDWEICIDVDELEEALLSPSVSV